MGERKLSWAEIFEAIGVAWCDGCPNPLIEHGSGAIENEPSGGIILHWRNRRVTRTSIHKALRKVAAAQHRDYAALPEWRRVYLINQVILDLGRQAHLRQPRSVFDLDRARLRYLLHEYTIEDRRHMTQSERDDFKDARRWAARS